jgi:hypothetical protein
LDDGEVIFDPLGIIGAVNRVYDSVTAKIAATKMNFEGMEPIIIVVGSYI